MCSPQHAILGKSELWYGPKRPVRERPSEVVSVRLKTELNRESDSTPNRLGK